MPKTDHNFTSGLNRDTAKHLFDANAWFDAKNIALSSEEHAFGSVINHKGNELQLEETGYKIVGTVTHNEELYYFLAEDNTDSDDYSSTSKIKKYTEVDGTSLLWDGTGLNLRVDKPIRGFALETSVDVKKLYWTDGNNQLRYANVAKDIATYNAEEFNMLQPFIFYTPHFTKYISGNLYTGSIQYAYRLIQENGSETPFSPACNVIPLSKDVDNYKLKDIKGQPQYNQDNKYFSDKGVEFIVYIDEEGVARYDYIEVVSLWYSDNVSDPIINIIDRRSVNTGNTNYVRIYDEDSSATYGSLTLDEFRALSIDFIPQDIDIKDNRLFAANIYEKYFDLDEYIAEIGGNDGTNYAGQWDARAYRFNSDGTARVNYGSTDGDGTDSPNGDNNYGLTNDIILEGSNWKDDAYNIHVEHNALNRANFPLIDGTPSEIVYPNRGKYQSDGTSLGGEGINISYTFKTKQVNIADDQGSGSITNYDENAYDINPDSRDWITGQKKGFQPLEIYRFGIVFYNEKGQQSFTKWIGDIKIPMLDYFGGETTQIISDTVDGTQFDKRFATNIYPSFIVNNVPTGLSYQIVYVKRNLQDRTVLFNGVVSQVEEKPGISDGTVYIPTVIPNTQNTWDNGGTYTIYEQDTNSVDTYDHILAFDSPDIYHHDSNYLNSVDFISQIGSVKLEHGSYKEINLNTPRDIIDVVHFDGTNKTSIDGTFDLDDDRLGGLNISSIASHFNHEPDICAIENGIWVEISNSHIENQPDTFKDDLARHTVFDSYTYSHVYHRKNEEQSSGLHTKSLLMENSGNSGNLSTFSNGDRYSTPIFAARRNIIPYNGWEYSNRQTNTYIVASDIHKDYQSGDELDCYNGDTLNLPHDMLMISPTITSDKFHSVFHRLPLFSSINPFLTYGNELYKYLEIDEKRFAAYVQTTDDGYIDDEMSFTIGPYNQYNNVYSKVNEAKTFIPESPYSNNQSEFPTRVRYSDIKRTDSLVDPFLKFRPNNYNEAENNYGNIKRIKVFNNRAYFFQKNAFGVMAINPKIQETDSSGATVVLGKGSVLDDFQYISTAIGISNKSDIVASPNAIYWMDEDNSEIYQLSKELNPLGQSGKVTSYFNNNLDKYSSFTGIYDPYYKLVYFTVKNDNSNNHLGYESTSYDKSKFTVKSLGPLYIQSVAYNELMPTVGNRLIDTSILDFISDSNSVKLDTGGSEYSVGDTIDLSNYLDNRNVFTLGYSEMLQSFISFYDFIPNGYFNINKSIYSIKQNTNNQVYLHNVNDYGYYYGSYYPVIVDIIVGLGAKALSEFYGINYFGNIEFENQSQYNTFATIRAMDDYEVSDEINLYPEGGTRTIMDTSGYHIDNVSNSSNLYNVKRNMRNWHIIFPRYLYNGESGLSNRYRDHYVRVRLTYNNDKNHKFELNNLQIQYRPLTHL